MNVLPDISKNIDEIKRLMNVDKSFDIINRDIIIGGRKASFFFVDGFIKDEVMEKILESFFSIDNKTMEEFSSVKDFSETFVPYVEVSLEKDITKIINNILSGPTVLFIDGYDEAIVMDLRTYPARTSGEPEKEKVTRGSNDAFVETIVFNTALIRRRIRDPRLTFEMLSAGERSKTDIAVGYIEGIHNEKILKMIRERIQSMKVEAVTMGQESLIEGIVKYKFYNPFPKVKYTERPDVAAAQLLEGDIVIIVDNNPSAVIMPYSFFDFVQEIEDFYYPPITGCYLRFIRVLVVLATLLLTPTWLLLMKYKEFLPDALSVLTVSEMNKVPLIVQFLLLEVGIDGLKMASLNTPTALGTSLGIIGGLILGDFAVQSGWFVPDTILYMAIIAVGSFSHPNIELGYAIKFCRILLLILTWALGIAGYIIGIVLICIIIASNRTIDGRGYLYPLIPFNGKDLKGIFFRKSLHHKSREE